MSGTPLKEWLSNRGIDPRLYYAWRNMKNRCRPRYPQHADYYDRGILVCPEWTDSFSTFAADMGPHPGNGFSLDRERNAEGYSKFNCRWVTRPVQQQNRRPNLVTPSIARDIRARRDRGERTCAIAKSLSLPYRVVSYVVHNHTWKGV